MPMHRLRNRTNLSKWIQSETCILPNVFKKKNSELPPSQQSKLKV